MDFHDDQLYGYQLVDLLRILEKYDTNPDEGYSLEDSVELIKTCEYSIEGIKNMIRLIQLLKPIHFNYQSTRTTWSSFRIDKMNLYKNAFTEIHQNCINFKNSCRDSLFYATYLSTMVVELFETELGDDYIHTIIPIIINQCIKFIKSGFNSVRTQKELVVMKNLEERWSCPICYENKNPDMGHFIWMVSDNKDEKGNQSCGHKIHAKCFLKSLEYSNKCPLCRQDIFEYSTYRINWYRE